MKDLEIQGDSSESPVYFSDSRDPVEVKIKYIIPGRILK